ncbi:MAG: DUF1178 family protein [Rhodospirillaceae bacterium]|nr:DUF1178 family protein [Rhodospirillaceae bacterium]
MILFDLRCAKGHQFEAWFRDGATYDRQADAGELACPICGGHKIEKAPMAPRIGKGRSTAMVPSEAPPAPTPTPDAATMAVMGAHLKALRALRRKVEESCDYVGPEFAEEARKIHYGETDARGIYGETTSDEAAALEDEGIEVARIPWVPRES